MEDMSAVSTSRPATPALVHSPSTARSSFSSREIQAAAAAAAAAAGTGTGAGTSTRPTPTRQPSWGKRHASLDSSRERPIVPVGPTLASSLPSPSPSLCGPPPPEPPHIHTPPSSPSARPYAYPFLPSCEPRGDAMPSVSAEVSPDKYVLSCRMPHFDHSSITVASRKGRSIVIAADRWGAVEPFPLSLDPTLIPGPPQPAHFERRVTFGWDADMTRVHASFDGVTLRVTVPRRMLPTGPATATRDRTAITADRHCSQPPSRPAKREVAWPLG
ncbi:hypothetical protein RSOLAG1IB_08701 [Rhizoctonia solani AG-1 IB]|uniref:SHSP domain-containing protein n=1 Tax=Thanatephorus cucumeris (strain AG1-IB / isolate 7/3/14) TaxID=1108050 RepID=A0A0B7FR01_THACB|nr:hypothetical protein RSOLAG1IB_08701 [Rhizoctonia solani AG-1 IB]